jgi:hypothetical protein
LTLIALPLFRPGLALLVRGGFCCLALVLAACAGEQRQDTNASDVIMTDQAHDSLRLTMQLPARVRAGDLIALEFEITNVSARSLDLYLTGRDITIDITIRNAAGDVIWRSLDGVAVPSILQLRTLPSGESITVRQEWQPRTRLEPGMYTVAAELLGEAENRLRFATSRVELTG